MLLEQAGDASALAAAEALPDQAAQQAPDEDVEQQLTSAEDDFDEVSLASGRQIAPDIDKVHACSNHSILLHRERRREEK